MGRSGVTTRDGSRAFRSTAKRSWRSPSATGCSSPRPQPNTSSRTASWAPSRASARDAWRLRMDGGRPGNQVVEIDPARHPHLDHGYAVTSHSAQGQTAARVLIHVDTELGAKDLLNNRMAYVAVSRGAHDAQLFTNDREGLGAALGRDVSHRSAHAPEVRPEQQARAVEAVESAQAKQAVEAAVENARHWKPLRDALAPHQARQFEWIAETGPIQSYRHIETGRNLHIDGRTGQFYDQERNRISLPTALDHAMPPSREHSHIREQSIEYGHGLGM